MKDEDYAFETRRQKRIDQGAKPKIGSCSGVHRPDRYSNTDPWKNVPFVEPEAPADGLMALYVVCILLVAGYFAYIVWGVP
jgi:hypothetical protein